MIVAPESTSRSCLQQLWVMPAQLYSILQGESPPGVYSMVMVSVTDKHDRLCTDTAAQGCSPAVTHLHETDVVFDARQRLAWELLQGGDVGPLLLGQPQHDLHHPKPNFLMLILYYQPKITHTQNNTSNSLQVCQPKLGTYQACPVSVLNANLH